MSVEHLKRDESGLLILNQAALNQIEYSLEDVLGVVENAFLSLRHPESTVALKAIIQPSDQRSIAYSMAGRDGYSETVGFKVVYEFDPDRTRDSYQFHSFIFICDDSNGKPLALMDVVQLGPLRTAATSALLARAAASKQAKTALIVGSGVQAQVAAPMLVAAMPELETLLIYGHFEQGLLDAQEALQRYYPNRQLEIISDLQQGAGQADVIVGVAGLSSSQAVLHRWLKPGAVVVLVGYGVDADVLHQADVVIATNEAQMQVTSDDLADVNGFVPLVNAELTDILLGNRNARENDQQIVFAYNSGMVITDIALAKLLTSIAKQQGLGQSVAMW